MKAKLSSSSAGKGGTPKGSPAPPGTSSKPHTAGGGGSALGGPAGANGPSAAPADQRQSLPPLTPEEMRRQYAGAQAGARGL